MVSIRHRRKRRVALRRFGRLVAVVACLALFGAATAFAQENLDAGKSPAQLFASDCSVCHQSPKGLAKGSSSSSLSSFLRQHYTSSQQNASVIAGYLLSGAGAGERKPAHQPTTVSRTPTPPEPPNREHNARTAKRHPKPKSEEPRKHGAETAKPAKKPEKKEKEVAKRIEHAAKPAKKPAEKKDEPKKTEQAAVPPENPVREPKAQGDTKPEIEPATAAAPKHVTAIAPRDQPAIRTLPSGAKVGESPGGPRQDAVPLAGVVPPPTRAKAPRTDNIAD
jgi:hypothetical protein